MKPKQTTRRLLMLAVIFIALAATSAAQGTIKKDSKSKKNVPGTVFTAEQRFKAYPLQQELEAGSLFKNLPWQFIGPTNISGRTTSMAVETPKGKSYTVYAGTASGGVWKTSNEGTSWEPVFEHAASTAIGAISIAPSDQQVVWVGTGEANIFRSSNAGTGVYKSVDAGKTWTHMGLVNTYTIPRIVIHPTNPDIVYVASSGCEWTTNPDRGLYRTTDGGKNWQIVLFINEKTGIIDLVMDPSNPNTLYASSWERIRKKWNDPRNEDGYDGSKIYKTTDGGTTWQEICSGLPSPRYCGRIGLDVSRSNPNVLYAFIDNYEEAKTENPASDDDSYGRPKGKTIQGATVYRSDNKGLSWYKVSQENEQMRNMSATYGWVFGQMKIDPNNENKLYVMGLELNVSSDSGKTFHSIGQIHGDHHGLWIDPANSDYLVNVNDGGITISYDGGKTFREFTNNLPVVQCFTVNYDMATPFHVYSSIQDHGSYRGIVDLKEGRSHIPAVTFERAPGWEGNHHAIDPTDANIVYSAAFYGSISRTNMATGEETDLVPKPAAGEKPYRAQWLAPFMLSPHNPRILYYGNNFVFRSLNMGEKWEKISPDLTWNDTTKSGDIPYQTIFTLSESPLRFGTIYAGTDDGRLHVTQDGGLHWKEITSGLAKNRWISRVIASAYDAGTVYATQNGKRDDDFAPYIWKSVDYGKTWKSIVANIPSGPVNVLREDPVNKDILYVGTDWGVYVSLDGGNRWNALSDGLPTTFVHDLIIHPRDLIMVAATHGRGMFAMDVSYIEGMTKEILSEDLHVFDIPNGKVSKEYPGYGRFPISPVTIPVSLKNECKIQLSVSDSSKTEVFKLETEGAAGVNFLSWDLSVQKADSADKSNSGEARKKYVAPGKYTLVIRCNSNTEARVISVEEQKQSRFETALMEER
jgi:photosystem II stability/assembly factor-like uncharacterized protein